MIRKGKTDPDKISFFSESVFPQKEIIERMEETIRLIEHNLGRAYEYVKLPPGNTNSEPPLLEEE